MSDTSESLEQGIDRHQLRPLTVRCQLRYVLDSMGIRDAEQDPILSWPELTSAVVESTARPSGQPFLLLDQEVTLTTAYRLANAVQTVVMTQEGKIIARTQLDRRRLYDILFRRVSGKQEDLPMTPEESLKLKVLVALYHSFSF